MRMIVGVDLGGTPIVVGTVTEDGEHLSGLELQPRLPFVLRRADSPFKLCFGTIMAPMRRYATAAEADTVTANRSL